MPGIFYIEIAIQAFDSMIKTLTESSCQTFQLLRPSSKKVSYGEPSFLTLLAACQQGDWRGASTIVLEIVDPSSAEKFIGAVSTIAEILEARGNIIKKREHYPHSFMLISRNT